MSQKVPPELKSLFPEFCKRAQEIYDAWEQDDEGHSEVYASGGICDDVAEELCSAMMDSGIECATVHYEQANHTVAVAKLESGVYEVDIPWGNYEEGGWYKYRKLPNVIFKPDMVMVDQLSTDPEDYEQYTEGD